MLGVLALGSAFALVGALFVRPAAVGLIIGVIFFLAYRVGVVRTLLCHHHVVGLRRSRTGQLEEAVAAFRASAAFWSRHPVLDRHRAWLLGTAVAWPYVVLARYNEAFCLARLDRTDEALAALDGLLADHPGVTPARELRDALQGGMRLASPAPPPADWSDLDDLEDGQAPTGEPEPDGPGAAPGG